jgi:hypothetical protein
MHAQIVTFGVADSAIPFARSSRPSRRRASYAASPGPPPWKPKINKFAQNFDPERVCRPENANPFISTSLN